MRVFALVAERNAYRGEQPLHGSRTGRAAQILPCHALNVGEFFAVEQPPSLHVLLARDLLERRARALTLVGTEFPY